MLGEIATKIEEIDVGLGNISLQMYSDLKKAVGKFFETSKESKEQAIAGWNKDLITILLQRDKRYTGKKADSSEEFLKFSVQVFKDMQDWAERENKYLSYNPTKEEVQAGLGKFSQEIGIMGTVRRLAKDYGKDPDTILDRWSWGKIFQILRADCLESKYQRKLNDIISKKK